MTINSFSGDHWFLSNFYWHKNLANQLWGYPTSEHAYQAAKTLDKEARQRFKDQSMTAGQSKRAGRGLEIREDWEEVKDEVMLTILRAKFYPNTYLARKLLETGDEELIEGNNWHDNYWGECSCVQCRGVSGKRKSGNNMLGKLLMQVRDELRG